MIVYLFLILTQPFFSLVVLDSYWFDYSEVPLFLKSYYYIQKRLFTNLRIKNDTQLSIQSKKIKSFTLDQSQRKTLNDYLVLLQFDVLVQIITNKQTRLCISKRLIDWFGGIILQKRVHLLDLQQLSFIIAMNTKALGQKIFQDRGSLKILMSTNNPYFNQRMKLIVNKNFDEIKEVGIFEKRNIPTSNLFFFNANLFDSSRKEELQDYILHSVQHFYSNFADTFALVYVHSSFFDFLAFRKIIEKWPEHFFYRLRRIYILTPSVMVKFIETFSLGSFYSLCDQLFYNVESEQDLRFHDQQILKNLGEFKNASKQPIFKSSIKIIQSSIYGKKVDQYDLVSGRYPAIIIQLLSRLVRDTNQLKIEGIFRKSCDSQQLQRLQQQIQKKQKGAIWNEQDILIVCGCLKKIMNNLSLPLFNYQIYQKIINFTPGDEIQFIKNIFSAMEYVNFKVFVLLTVFLNDYIISQQSFNKMSGYNLAVVFGPCFFRPKQYDLKDLIYSGKFAKILVISFDKYNEMFDTSQIKLARGALQQLRQNPFKN